MNRREGHLSVLLGVALLAVVADASLGWAWLPVVFPATGVLFAGGGALAAAGVDRAGSARGYLGRAVLRLLAPLWLFAAVLVPVMLAAGWPLDEPGAAPLTWRDGWRWLVPLADPPAASTGLDWTAGTWFVRTSLWFVLLTPALLWLARRWPLRLATVPAVTLALVTLGLAGVSGLTGRVVLDLCVWSGCWLTGFAAHDGRLRRWGVGVPVAVGAVLVAAGLWLARPWWSTHAAGSISDLPAATALYSTGGVLVLLALGPAGGRLVRRARLAGALSLVGRRAVTVYLWTGVAVAVAPVLLDAAGVGDVGRTPWALLELGTAVVLLIGYAVAAGWLEDLADRRRAEPVPDREYAFRDNVVQDGPPGAA